MKKCKIIFIGSSNIINHHIVAAKQNGFELHGICTTRKNNSKALRLGKDYKIKKIYKNINIALKDAATQKNIYFVIASRVKDNVKILKKCLSINPKVKILTEKPISFNHNEIKDLIQYNNRIFVGYNRIYYESVKFLKIQLNKKKKLNIIIKCPEKNKKNIFINTCHIFSILYYCFGELKLIYKIKNNSFINCMLKDKKRNIFYMSFYFNASENFSIQVYDNVSNYLLKPIEKLTVFEGLNKKNVNMQTQYFPKKKKIINERFSKKPGFYDQYVNFKKFISNEHHTRFSVKNSYKLIKLVCKICK
jgi:hypothetical protein